MRRRRQKREGRPGLIARLGRRNIQKLKKLGLVVLLLSVVPAIEVLARWISPELPSWQGGDNATVIMTGHPTRLWGLSEGVRENMGTTARVNAWGFRGSIPEIPRPEGTHRILVLGDSTFFGHGIAEGYTLEDVLEKQLNTDGVEVDVVNGGVPGYSTEQTLLWLDDIGWSLEPDLLVIGSLFSDTNFDAFRDKDLLKSRRFADYNPFAHSAAFRLFVSFVSMALPGRKGKIVVFSQREVWPDDGVRRVPVQDYATNLSTIARQAAAREIGVSFVAPIAADAVVSSDSEAHPWDPYLDAQSAVAKYYGLPLVRFRDIFRRTLDEHLSFRGANAGTRRDEALKFLFLDDYHPTLFGHRIMGSVLATALSTAGWPERTLVVDEDDALPETLVSGLTDAWENDGKAINDLSPHSRLFSSTADGPLEGGARNLGMDADNRPSPEPTWEWEIPGEVRAPKGPINIVVRGSDGKTVAAVLLAQPGRFSIRLSRTYETVSVVFTGPTGWVVETEAQVGGPNLDIDLVPPN